jgi:acylphosphatase
MTHVQAIVHGTVQGVGFRYSTLQAAKRLGVSGFVRNRADGTVEIQVTGAADQVKALLDWAHHGPAGARVSRVEVNYPSTQETFDGFTIER